MSPLASFDDTIVVPDWPAPARVRAAVTTRLVHGASSSPFDAFNLGAQCGAGNCSDLHPLKSGTPGVAVPRLTS